MNAIANDTGVRVLVSDIDGTLLDDGQPTSGLNILRGSLAILRGRVRVIYATGRSIDSMIDFVEKGILPAPEAMATLVGAQVWFPPWQTPDRGYQQLISVGWDRDRVREAAEEIPSGLEIQPEDFQTPFKLSYFVESPDTVDQVKRVLADRSLDVRVVYSGGRFLDLMPPRSGKLAAVDYILAVWGIPRAQAIACGDSGNDLDMLQAEDLLGVAVGNAEVELSRVAPDEETIYHADQPHAEGVLEGAKALEFWPARE